MSRVYFHRLQKKRKRKRKLYAFKNINYRDQNNHSIAEIKYF